MQLTASGIEKQHPFTAVLCSVQQQLNSNRITTHGHPTGSDGFGQSTTLGTETGPGTIARGAMPRKPPRGDERQVKLPAAASQLLLPRS